MLLLGLTHIAWAWKPEGWVNFQSSHVFSNTDQRWYYFENNGVNYLYWDYTSQQWRNLEAASGWWWIDWPFGYSVDTGAWSRFNIEGASVNVWNFERQAWSAFGNEPFGDIPIDASSYLSILSGDPRYGNRTTRKVLDDYLPPVDSQGQQGSCVGWATAYYAKTAIEKKEEGWNVTSSTTNIFSPAFIYNQRPNRFSGDNGMVISDALDILVSKGCAKYPAMPYSDRDHQTQPSSSALSQALNYRAATYERLGGFRSLNTNTIQEIKDWLVSQETPLVFGMEVYDSFMRYRGENNGVITDVKSGDYRGGHAMAIVGFDDNVGGGSFKVVNSWGVNWGSNGFVWIPYSELRRVVHSVYTIEDLSNSGPSPSPTPQPPITSNDLISGAGILQNGNVVNGNVGPGQGNSADIADWFKFSVSSGQRATISLTNLSADIDIRLTDGSEITLERSVNSGTQSEEIVYSFTASGTYYIKVYPYETYTQSSYRLELSINSAQGNDSPYSPSTLTTNTDYSGAVGGSDPRDWWRVYVAANTRVVVTLEDLSADIDLYLYESASATYYTLRSYLAGSSDESITFTSDSAGYYYVLVKPYGSAVSSYTLRASTSTGADLDAKSYSVTYWNYSNRVEMQVNELNVQNVGYTGSGSYRVGWGLSSSNTPGSSYYLGSKQWIDSNGTGAGNTSTWSNSSIATIYKSSLASGSYFFVFHADVDRTVAEPNELNNYIYSTDPVIYHY